MSIQYKLVAILLLGYALYTACDFYFQRTFILEGILDLERQEYEKDMRRCVEAVQRELFHLNIFCADWSSWDDTHDFAMRGGSAYVDANFMAATYRTNRLNLIAVADTTGLLRYSRYYNEAEGVVEGFRELPEGGNAGDQSYWLHNPDAEGFTGVWLTSRGAMLIAVRPILPTLGADAGPVAGAILMGRALDSDLIADLRAQTSIHFDVLPDDGTLAPLEQSYRDFTLDGSIAVAACPHGKDLDVYTHYPGLPGRPGLLLRAHVPRDFLHHALRALNMDAIAASIGAAVVFLLVLLVAQQSIVAPLKRLVSHVRIIGKTGALAEIPASPRRDEIGVLAREFNGMVARLREDDTQRRAAEAALRQSEARTATILEAAPDVILAIDADGRVERANNALRDMLGRAPEAVRGAPAADLFMPEGQALVAALIGAAAGLGAGAGMDLPGRHADGHAVPVFASASRAVVDGLPITILILKDLTEYRQLQEHLSKHRHLARLGEMSASIAHDIRNPLAGIKGAAQLIQADTPQDAPNRELLGEIVEQVDRVEGTIRELLRFSLDWKPRREAVDLCALAAGLAREARLRPEFANVAIACSGAARLEVDADPALLRDVLWNLLVNAQQAMPGGGRVVCHAEVGEDAAILRVHDSGPGIPEDRREAIFEPFVTTKVHGTGLGLAICRRILDAHGATIAAAAAPEGGAAFVLRFPKETH